MCLGVDWFLQYGIRLTELRDHEFLMSLWEQKPVRYYASRCDKTFLSDDRVLKHCLWGHYLGHALGQTDSMDYRNLAARTVDVESERLDRVMHELIEEGLPQKFFTTTLHDDHRQIQARGDGLNE